MDERRARATSWRRFPAIAADRLAGAGVPILFLVGEHDVITPPHIIERCRRGVPGSQLALIAGSGHSTHFPQPRAFNATVMRFLESALLVM